MQQQEFVKQKNKKIAGGAKEVGRPLRMTVRIPAFMMLLSDGDSKGPWLHIDARHLWKLLRAEYWQRDFAAFLVVVNRKLSWRATVPSPSEILCRRR
jgi:hypothetical protein